MAEIIFYFPLRYTGVKPIDDRGGTDKAARTTRVESDRVGEAHRSEVATDCPIRKRRPFPCLHDAKASRGTRWQIGTDCARTHAISLQRERRSPALDHQPPSRIILHEASDISLLNPVRPSDHLRSEKSWGRKLPEDRRLPKTDGQRFTA
jgi:hypothetical protein